LPKKLLLLVDLMTTLALSLAFLGFSVNGINAELAILPFYDFLSLPMYQITLMVTVAASVLISVAIYRKNSFVILLCGLVLQEGVIANIILNRTLYEPIFLVLSEDPGLNNAASHTLQISFYVAPWYEIVDTLTFIFFMLGILLLFARISLRFGIIRSFLLTALAGSGLLLYFEYVTINPNFDDGSASLISSEKLTNFSNSWPLIGGLTNIELFWICLLVLVVSSATLGLLLAFSANTYRSL